MKHYTSVDEMVEDLGESEAFKALWEVSTERDALADIAAERSAAACDLEHERDALKERVRVLEKKWKLQQERYEHLKQQHSRNMELAADAFRVDNDSLKDQVRELEKENVILKAQLAEAQTPQEKGCEDGK